MGKILSAIIFIVLLSAAGLSIAENTPTQTTLSVMESAVATDIENHKPIGASEKFPASVGKLWCYTRIQGSNGDNSIVHKWFYKDSLLMAVPLRVKGNPYRTYSTKTIDSSQKGAWRIEVADENGKILKTLSFTVE